MKVDGQQVVGRNPIVEIPARPIPQPTHSAAIARPPSTVSPATVAAASPKPPQTPQDMQAAQRRAMTAALPEPKVQDQKVDLTYGRMSYRVGELVWYNTGITWALGVVVRRWTDRTKPLPVGRRYLLQPLAAPFQPQTQVVIDAEVSMRPWLAWSPPAFCHSRLNLPNPPTFASMDWNALVSGRYGPPDSNMEIVKVDASILAARAIDATYTPFGYLGSQPLPTTKPGANAHFTTHKISWNGIYFGGERIWVGDPVRLRMSTNEGVLVVHQIHESPAPQPTSTTPTSISLIGNIITCSTLASDAVTPDRQHLVPQRMREDLELRNRAAQATGGPESYWRLVTLGHRLELSEIKGRWYESTIMGPIVGQQPSYEACLRSGQTQSVALTFNMRTDVNNSAGNRCESRSLAFGRSVPETTRLVEGMDEPSANELPRAPDQPQQQPQAQQSDFDAQMNDGQGNGLDDFMDLSGMEGGDSMPGFGQEYASQGSNYFQ